MDEREIEAVARAWWAHDPKAFDTLTPEWRALQMRRAEDAIAALDRVRDARGDNEALPWVCPECGERHRAFDGECQHECNAELVRSPQGEGHEADHAQALAEDAAGIHRPGESEDER